MASTSSEPGMKSETVGGSGGEASEIGQQDQQVLMMYRGVKKAKKERGCTAKERISKMPPCAAGKRSSIYRGVTRHRWTGRYEAHLWDKSTWNQNQNKKGKQVYLGAYDDEEAAARAYDLAALKYWGPGTLINFPVTDYSRDLEEMQNLSREDYLASLRRKSSGFSRGISKYRGLSSRWESSYGRIGGADYFSGIHYGTCEDPSLGSDFGGSFPIDRKFDLTSCIKWWRPNKTRQMDSAAKSYEETKQGSEDVSSELKTDWAMHPIEPYQMPRLGGSREERKHKGSTLSALRILSQSDAYKSLEEKLSKEQENDIDNEDNENKNTINRIDHGKTVEKSASHDCASDRQGASVAMSAELSLQRNICPFTSLLNAPLLTNYNAIDPLADPVLWSSLVPMHPAGHSRAAEVPKSETSSTYTFNQPPE